MYYSQQKSRTHPGARPLGAASLDTAPPLVPQGPFTPPPQPPQGHTPIVNPFERRPKFPPLPADPRGPKWATRIPYYHRFPWHAPASAYVASTYQQTQAQVPPVDQSDPPSPAAFYAPPLTFVQPRGRSVWQSTLLGVGLALSVTVLIWFLMFLIVSSVRPLTPAPNPSQTTFRAEPSIRPEAYPLRPNHAQPKPAPQPKKSPDFTESHF